MRFFTPEIATELSEGDTDNARMAYEKYMEHVKTLPLSAEVAAIADATYVDDALVARVLQEDSPPKLELTFVRGHLQIGYTSLRFCYEEPEVSDAALRSLLRIADSAKTQRTYGTDARLHELDVDDDGKIIHTIHFRGEWVSNDIPEVPIVLSVSCRNLIVKETPRAGRRLPPFRDRYRIARLNASSA